MGKEKWEEYYTPEQLHQLQKIEIELFKVFVQTCEKLNLEYVVYGGTLLGVEKYKGFIPWDDDIDVALPRESYMAFCKLAEKELSDEYVLQTPYNSKNSPFPYTKLRRKGTQYVEYLNRNIEYENGIYIDIYPIDRIPDNEQLRQKQYNKVKTWILIYVFRQGRLYDRKEKSLSGKIKNVIRWSLCHLLKVFPQEYCVKKLDQYMTMYNAQKTERFAALNSPNYDNIYEHLYPLERGLFEGMDVSVPGDYQTHLFKRYGDYHDLPEEKDRVGHVPYLLEFGENH